MRQYILPSLQMNVHYQDRMAGLGHATVTLGVPYHFSKNWRDLHRNK